MKKAKGAGSELSKKKQVAEWDKVGDDWNKLVDSMSDQELEQGLLDGGYMDAWFSPKEQKKYKNLYRYFSDTGSREVTPAIRKELKDWFRKGFEENSDIDSARSSIDMWAGKTDEQISRLKSLGLNNKKYSRIWETKNGSYRLYTQQGVNAFLAKFGHLTPREINQLPDSKLVSRKKNKPFDAEGTQKVLDNHKEPAPLVRPTDSKFDSWSRYYERVRRRYWKSTDSQEKERLRKELSVANENMRLKI